MTEQEAHDKILAALRRGETPGAAKPSSFAHWVMRERDGVCRIVDVGRWDTTPIYQGATWLDVAKQMGIAS